MTNRLVMADARRLVERSFPDDGDLLEPWESVTPPEWPAVRCVDYVARPTPLKGDDRAFAIFLLSIAVVGVLLATSGFWGPWLDTLGTP